MVKLGFAAFLLWACKSDPPPDRIVDVGNADASIDSGAAAKGTGGSGAGASMAATGGDPGGSAGKTGGMNSSNIFPSVDASTASGGTTASGTGDAGSGSDADGSVPMGSIDAAACFDSGVEVAFEGNGTGSCDNPLRVDLSAGYPGDVSYVTLPDVLLDTDLPVPDKCGAGTTRDLALLVWVPLGADLEVTVDGVIGADPLVLVVDPATADCASGTAAQCVDRGGMGACEYLKIPAPTDADPGYRQIIVSEVIATDTPYTLRLRLQWSGTGA